MTGLVLAARRTRMVAIGTDATLGALRRGAALVMVALDAGSIASSHDVTGAIAEGRAMAWKTKEDLGALLGEKAVALFAILHTGIAAELKALGAASNAGATTTTEGAGCSSRCPEAR